jgi:hypothetical protein
MSFKEHVINEVSAVVQPKEKLIPPDWRTLTVQDCELLRKDVVPVMRSTVLAVNGTESALAAFPTGEHSRWICSDPCGNPPPPLTTTSICNRG